jgi:SAM-dependent methyltransferase
LFERWQIEKTILPGDSMSQDNLKDCEITQGWNTLASRWIDMQGEAGDVNQKWIINPTLFRLAGDVQGTRVLDAACGGGHLAREFARRGATVVGVDISQVMIAIANSCEQAKPLGIHYIIGNLANLPDLESAAFDLAISSMAFMNIENAGEAFCEIARLLRPNGRFVFSIPHPCYPRITGNHGVFAADAQGEEWLKEFCVANYHTEGRFDVIINEASIPTFHRTLGTYFSLLALAGFVVTDFCEPRPVDVPEAKTELGPGWWDANHRIPYYLVLGCQRKGQNG